MIRRFRFLAAVLLAVLLAPLLICFASAEGLLDLAAGDELAADQDEDDYYSLSSGLMPYAAARWTDGTFFGVEFLGGYYDEYYVDGIRDTQMTWQKFLPIFNTALANIDAEILSEADLVPIQALLNTYLPRIDTNTESLHGDLLNIQQALGWTGSGSTVLQWLQSLYSLLGDVHAGIALLEQWLHNIYTGVTTRQDSMFNFWSSGNWPSYSFRNGSTGNNISSPSFTSFPLAFQESQRTLIELFSTTWSSYLGPNGNIVAMSGSYVRPSISYVLQSGLIGLSRNIVGNDNLGSFSAWRGPEQSVARSAGNVLDMLALLGGELQNPLAKLQYVWADDQDIEIAQKNQPVKNEIEENFVGDGDAAVKASDIGDVAGISGSVKDSFSGAGSASDAFTAISDSNSYSFFSQAVSDSLDTVGVPSAQSDEDFMSGFELGEDGFYHVADLSPWDVSAFLGGRK